MCVVRAFVCLCVCVFVLHIHLHTSPTRTWEQHRVPKLRNRVTVTYNVREREICNGDNASRRAAVADLFTRSKRFTKRGSHRSLLRVHFTCTCRGNNIWSSSSSSRCPLSWLRSLVQVFEFFLFLFSFRRASIACTCWKEKKAVLSRRWRSPISRVSLYIARTDYGCLSTSYLARFVR